MNRIILIGRLTKDPELKYLQDEKSVTNFSLAVNRKRKDADGNYPADFFNITAWNKAGETIKQYCAKGHRLAVEGRVEFEKWTDNEGNSRTSTVVILENFEFLQQRESSTSDSQQSDSHNYGEPPPEDAVPY